MSDQKSKERPILFSGPMVRAILDGTKTQTRRLVKPQPTNLGGPNFDGHWSDTIDPAVRYFGCPHGEIGDRLWVKETHARVHPSILQSLDPDPKSAYWETLFRASEDLGEYQCRVHWKPSIFMRREYSRILLDVAAVRAERLQDITEADAWAEGIGRTGYTPKEWERHLAGDSSVLVACHDAKGYWENFPTARHAYASLWDAINGAGSWQSNPWVWAVEFPPFSPTKQPKVH